MKRWLVTAWSAALTAGRLLIGPVLALSAGYALWACLRGHVGQLIALAARPQAAAMFAAALTVEFCGLYLSAQAFRQASAVFGAPLGQVAGLRVFSGAMLGKYVPGPTWSAVASVRLGSTAGVAPGRMVATYLLSSVVSLVTAVTTGLLAAPSLLSMRLLWLLPVPAAGLLLVWRPRIVVRLAEVVGRLRGTAPWAGRMRPAHVRRGTLLELSSWLTGGLHLWLITRALGAAGLVAVPLCVGAFALATEAGAVAMIAPDGLGVREAVLMAALSRVLPLPQAAAAVLVSRVCCTIAEVLGGVLVLTLARGPSGCARDELREGRADARDAVRLEG
jgi:hypothetical protein